MSCIVHASNAVWGVQDEEVITLFNDSCSKLGITDRVEAVRLVRDSASQLGKGFGFVHFRDQAAARAALSCDGQLLRKRPIRVTKAVKVPAHLKDLGKGSVNRVAGSKGSGATGMSMCALLASYMVVLYHALSCVSLRSHAREFMLSLASTLHMLEEKTNLSADDFFRTAASPWHEVWLGRCCAVSVLSCPGVRQSKTANKAVNALKHKAEPAENWQGFKTKGLKKSNTAPVARSSSAGHRPVEGKRKTSEKRPSVALRKNRSLDKQSVKSGR